MEAGHHEDQSSKHIGLAKQIRATKRQNTTGRLWKLPRSEENILIVLELSIILGNPSKSILLA